MTALLQAYWPNEIVDYQPGEWDTRMMWQGQQPAREPAARNVCRTELRFGRYRLVPGARLLLRDGAPVELGGRAFDLLHLLISWRGEVVEKEAIVRHVWPTTCVQESNLRFQIAALRRLLGRDNGLIKTIPGRGYLFADEFDPA